MTSQGSRVFWRLPRRAPGRRPHWVVAADRLLIMGLALLIPAICSAVLLITDVDLGRWAAIVGSSATALVGLVPWYALPLAIRRSGHGVAPPSHRRRRSPSMES